MAATLHHSEANVEVEVFPETLRGIVGIGVLAPTVEELVDAAKRGLKNSGCWVRQEVLTSRRYSGSGSSQSWQQQRPSTENDGQNVRIDSVARVVGEFTLVRPGYQPLYFPTAMNTLPPTCDRV